MKVVHAGEHGAVNIYRAQLLACRWRSSDITSELREFLDHEMRHREIFAAELICLRVYFTTADLQLLR
jgi:3-demethoxyubiquinol 3-hydroxylase